MEKLIELLNEYEDLTDAEKCEQWCIDDYGRISEGGWWFQGTENWICSKKFGFIKRLVDNDKIDLDKLKDNTSFTMLTHSIGLGCEWHTAHEGESILRAIGTNAIIVYLSIQDEPIKFLISILK